MTWRPRGFRLGSMRERITVQSMTAAADSFGQPVQTWSNTLTGEPATLEPTSGGEGLRGRQVEAGISAVFTVHWRSTYAPEQRVLHNGITYGIVYVRPVEGGRRYVELYCKAVV